MKAIPEGRDADSARAGRRTPGADAIPAGASPPETASHGFSLLEALVAVSIVGLALIAGLVATGYDVRATERVTATRTLLAAAERVSGELRTLAAADLARLVPGWHRIGESFGDLRWSAASMPAPGVPGLFDVDVSIAAPRDTLVYAMRLFRPGDAE